MKEFPLFTVEAECLISADKQSVEPFFLLPARAIATHFRLLPGAKLRVRRPGKTLTKYLATLDKNPWFGWGWTFRCVDETVRRGTSTQEPNYPGVPEISLDALADGWREGDQIFLCGHTEGD